MSDTVSMSSQRYAGMLAGFVNVNASKSGCSVAMASRVYLAF